MSTVSAVLDKAISGSRITPAEGLLLLEKADLNALGRVALAIRQRLHPQNAATYVIDRNINYTNVCVADCDFCAFYRRPGDPEEYVLPRGELFQKIRELQAVGGTQILMQGGHHPYLKIDWYEQLLGDIRREFPAIHIHAFSPSEIVHFSHIFKLPVAEIVRRFKAAGLHSIPGGGGEILVDRVRKIIAPKKAQTDAWLNVMNEAAKQGLQGSCTMVIGHFETLPERIEHLERLRGTQDDTRPFSAFIVWTMQPKNTKLEGRVQPSGAFDYLRTLAVARIYLDNIPNVQSSWVTQGAQIGQLSFMYGSNDWGGLMMEENVVSQAGITHNVHVDQMRRLSHEIGLTLRKRNFFYELIDEECGACPAK
jgi:cyclic dehypoxanthinyl futalosine synthase